MYCTRWLMDTAGRFHELLVEVDPESGPPVVVRWIGRIYYWDSVNWRYASSPPPVPRASISLAVEEAQKVLAELEPRLSAHEREALRVMNRELAAVASDAGRLSERTVTVTNEQLRQSILAGMDKITRLPGYNFFATSQEKADLEGLRAFISSADNDTLAKIGGLIPAAHTFAAAPALPKGFNPIALLPAIIQTAQELPAILTEGGRVAAIWGPVFTPKFDWSKAIPAVQQTAAEWPAIFAEGGKLVAIWLPVFGTPAA